MSSDDPHVKKNITDQGFWACQDAQIGGLVDSIVQTNYQFYADEGLGLFKAAVMQNRLVSDVIKALLPAPTFVFCRAFGRTRYSHCIMNRTDDARTRILTIFCWSTGSEGTLYSGSHAFRLAATAGPNGLLVVSNEALHDHDGIVPHAIKMEHGGL
ncbi:hypothetical protein ACHAP4_011290 [Fusarium culmorum]|uniref:Uncharacterized protein n=1 Tax=Fusarium culmorum TaxID=5516 RepID=A0A2T4GJ34_FUSCU|nr:hypothetical protein FCULG_00012827 [Fusarium culmorum]